SHPRSRKCMLYYAQFVCTPPTPSSPDRTSELKHASTQGPVEGIGRPIFQLFQPHRWLRGGHLQTLASFVLPRRISLPQAEERLIEVEPGVQVRCWCFWQDRRESTQTLIVVHGLEGSTESQYMLGVARNGLAAGMNVVLMNQRNCGGMD